MEYPKLNFNHIHLESIDSTNKFLINYVSKISPTDGFCVFSDFQTDGRGQYGRHWSSENKSNLLVSFAFQTDWLPESDIFFLHQMSSLSLIHVLQKYLPNYHFQIKWPNDILFHGQKIAGILIQNIYRGQKLLWSIIGIGLNLNQTHFESNLNATSMSIILGHDINRLEILQQVHDEILKLFLFRKNDQNFDLLEEYNMELFGLNTFAHYELNDGTKLLGKLIAVDELGRINVEIDNQIKRFEWSEIRILRS